jgi:ubiquinone/menaquinone biosynthesis C-methylase UbiE
MSTRARFYVWDSYWQDPWTHSYDIDAPANLALLDRYWFEFESRLQPGCTVLDVGCGNGAAAFAIKAGAMMSGMPLSVTGIDEAAIDPVRRLPANQPVLREIAFHARTEMEALPFADATFDVVVSQFGLEFGSPAKAMAEAARVLKPGGLLSMIALPAQSAAVQNARKAYRQARFLLADSNVFDRAAAMLKEYHALPKAAGDEKMSAALNTFCKEIEQAFSRFAESEVSVLSTIINAIYEVIANRKNATVDDQLLALASTRTRLAHYAARQQATIKAAIPDANFGKMRPGLATANFQVAEVRTMQAATRGGVLAFQLAAYKPL